MDQSPMPSWTEKQSPLLSPHRLVIHIHSNGICITSLNRIGHLQYRGVALLYLTPFSLEERLERLNMLRA